MASSRGDTISLQVRTMTTGTHDVQIPAQATVAALKQALVRPAGLPMERQRIIYGGRVLEDRQVLFATGIRNGHTLHLVEQDPATQHVQHAQQQQQGQGQGQGQHAGAPPGQSMDPSAFFQAMFGGGGVGPPPGGADVQAQVLGPFNITDAASWQQVQQQVATALSGMMPPPPGTAGGPQAAGGTPGAAVEVGGTSPFNFGNLFGPPGSVRGGGRDGSGGVDQGGADMEGWWDAVRPYRPPLQDDGGHLFQGLDALLQQMEGGSSSSTGAGFNASNTLPAIHQATGVLDGIPPQHRAAWQRTLVDWQRSFVAAARGVLEAAQLSSATRAVVNRVLEAAGAAPLRLSAAGGSRAVERRVCSFPVPDEEGEDRGGSPAAAAADEGSPGLTESGEKSNYGSNSESEWEEMGEEELAAQVVADAAAAPAGGRLAVADAVVVAEEDGAVEYYEPTDEGREEREGEDDFPSLQSWSSGGDEEEGQVPPPHRGVGTAAAADAGAAREVLGAGVAVAAEPAPALLPHGDMLLLGAVAVGELAHRFLLLLGAPATASAMAAGVGGQAAMVAATMERLRELTAVPTVPGVARDGLVADIRLLATHLSRVGAAAVELMRAMQYLGSGVEQHNLYLTRVQPGYVRLQGGSAHVLLPRPQRVQLVPAVVDVAVQQRPAVPGGPPGGAAAGGAGWQQVLSGMLGPLMGQTVTAPTAFSAAPAPGQATAASGAGHGRSAGRGAAQPAPAAAGAAAANGGGGSAGGGSAPGQQQQPVVRIHVNDQQGQPVPLAIPVGGAGGVPAAEVPPQIAGMAQLLLGRLGVDATSQQQLLGQFGGIMQALRQTSVASLDIPAISGEVGAAVRRVVSQQSASLRGTLLATAAPAAADAAVPAPGAVPARLQEEAAAFAHSVVPAVTSEVQRVLQQHLTRLHHSPAISAFAPYLEEIGIDLGADEGAVAGDEAAQPAPPAPPEARTAGSSRWQQQQREASAAEGAAAAPAAAPPPPDQPAAAPAAATEDARASSSGGGGKAAPAGLGQGFLLPRKLGRKATAPAHRPAVDAAGGGASRSAIAEPAAPAAASAPAPVPVAELQPREGKAAMPVAEAVVPAATPAPAPVPACTPSSGASVAGANLLAALGRSSQLSGTSRRTAPASSGTAASGDLALSRNGGAAGPGAGSLDLASLLGGSSAGGGSAGGGGGGSGLMGMLQGMMNNPAVMQMAQSPSMQRMAEQMFSGSAGAGNGSGLAGMVNAMAPMVGELLGGLAPSPHGGGGVDDRPGARGRSVAQPSASLDEILTGALPTEEAQRWRELIEADGDKQRQELGGGEGREALPRPTFSDAYLSALPPKTASSLLRLEYDNEEEEEERGQQAGAASVP